MNVINNIVALLFVVLVIFAFMITTKVGNSLTYSINETYKIIPHKNTTLSENSTIKYIFTVNSDIVQIFSTALQFFIAITVLFSIYSSFINRLSLQGFVISFMLGIAVGGIVLYITTTIYNLIVLVNNESNIGLDVSLFPSYFITNLQNIILANIIAMTLSFLFATMKGRRRKI